MTADPLILVRAAHFAATALACGTTGFLVLVAEPAANAVDAGAFAELRHRLTVLVWLALAIVVLSGAAWLVLLASNLLGASIADVCLHGGAWPVITETRFGLVWSARLVLTVLLGLLMLLLRARWFQVAAAAALLASLAPIGHAGATAGLAGAFHLVADMAHLLAAGAWLGGLPALALVLREARSRTARPDWDAFAVETVRRFSILGVLGVGILLASGIVNSWSLLSGPNDLIASNYGRLVTLKIGLFAAMVAIAAVNKFYLTPQLPSPAASRALQRNSVAEIVLGLFVLVFVGVLGTMPPAAHVHAAPVGIPPDASFVHIHTPEVMADVTIDPGRAGRADVTIRVSREDLSIFPAKDVRLALDPPTGGGRSVERAAVKQTDGTWTVNDVPLSRPGIWTTRVTVQPERGPPVVLDAPIVIAR